jgi:hypothetical protein
MKTKIDRLSVDNIQIMPDGMFIDVAIGGNIGIVTVEKNKNNP